MQNKGTLTPSMHLYAFSMIPTLLSPAHRTEEPTFEERGKVKEKILHVNKI